jgi:hypothetical protein
MENLTMFSRGSGGIDKTTCRIKENAHTRKLKSKFHCTDSF